MSPLSPLSPISRNQRCLAKVDGGLFKTMWFGWGPFRESGMELGMYTVYSLFWVKLGTTKNVNIRKSYYRLLYIYIYLLRLYTAVFKKPFVTPNLSMALEKDDIQKESINLHFVQSLFCGSHVSWIEKPCFSASNCGSFSWGEPRGMWGGKKEEVTSDTTTKIIWGCQKVVCILSQEHIYMKEFSDH